MEVTDEMFEAGLTHYEEGGCIVLNENERREAFRAIIEAAMSAKQAQSSM